MMKICHLTSVHPRFDTRIFWKECRSLARNGYGVALVVADGKGDEIRDGVSIYDVGPERNRLRRMIRTTRKVLAKARELQADLYHFHDPELIPAGLRLKRSGKIVIFDSHEDVPLQLRSKPYLGNAVREFVSGSYRLYERMTIRKFDAIITATPAIRDKFAVLHSSVIDINNFPLPGELFEPLSNRAHKLQQVCYIGGITAVRGIRELVMALPLTGSGTRLAIGGNFTEADFKREVKSLSGWDLVDELGFLDRKGVRDLLSRSLAGLVTLHPTANYMEALPVKMFEYMSAGIPVIASDFPLWREIVEKNQCGICVDPFDPKAIAQAIDFLVTHPDEAGNMGKNGQKAIAEKYNWTLEEGKLLSLYEDLSERK